MENVTEQSTPGLDLYWHIAKRRRWWIMVPFVIGWVAVLGASWVIPPKYRSESLILVEQQRVSTEYVTPNVTQDISARMNSLTEQIMSRTRLLEIANKYNLYAAGKTNVDADQVVDKLRKDISIDLQRAPQARVGDQLTAFKLSYVSGNAQLANQVTQELTSLFIDTSMKHSADVAKQTTDFLRRQLDLAQQDLDAQEKKLREFKTQNLGELPEQLQSNLQILTGLQGRLQASTEALSRAEQQRTYLESLRDRYRSANEAAATSPDAPITAATLDLQLEKLHQQLTDLQAKYTDKHPDVIRTKSEIAAAEAMKAKIEKQGSAQASNKPKSPQQLQAEAPLMQIESQLKANEIEIANRRAEIKGVNSEIGQYQGRLNLTPMREQQLAAILRDHDQSQKNYDELLKKTQQSELATNLQSEQQGEQFKLIDPASVPTKPYSPDRSKMALMGIAVGLALGVVIAGLVEFSDLHVYTEGQVKEIVGATMMIVGVPSLWTPSEISLNRRFAWMQAALAGIIVVAVTGITAFTFIKG